MGQRNLPCAREEDRTGGVDNEEEEQGDSYAFEWSRW